MNTENQTRGDQSTYLHERKNGLINDRTEKIENQKPKLPKMTKTKHEKTKVCII